MPGIASLPLQASLGARRSDRQTGTKARGWRPNHRGGSRSAIATLVEWTTLFIILVHLDGKRGAVNLRDRSAEQMSPPPVHLRRSLTCDQGTEMACSASTSPKEQISASTAQNTSLWAPSNSTGGHVRF